MPLRPFTDFLSQGMRNTNQNVGRMNMPPQSNYSNPQSIYGFGNQGGPSPERSNPSFGNIGGSNQYDYNQDGTVNVLDVFLAAQQGVDPSILEKMQGMISPGGATGGQGGALNPPSGGIGNYLNPPGQSIGMDALPSRRSPLKPGQETSPIGTIIGQTGQQPPMPTDELPSGWQWQYINGEWIPQGPGGSDIGQGPGAGDFYTGPTGPTGITPDMGTDYGGGTVTPDYEGYIDPDFGGLTQQPDQPHTTLPEGWTWQFVDGQWQEVAPQTDIDLGGLNLGMDWSGLPQMGDFSFFPGLEIPSEAAPQFTGGGGQAGQAAKQLYYPGTSGGFASVGTGIGGGNTLESLLKQLQG